MSTVISKEVAESMLSEWEEYMETEIDEDVRGTILKAIMGGRLDFDKTEEKFTLQLRKSITLENDETIDKIVVQEPATEQMERAHKTSDEYTQTIKLLSFVTGHPESVVRRLKMRDSNTAGGLLYFFGS